MKSALSYLLMLQKDINSKQKVQKGYTLYLGNIAKDFRINNMEKTIF